MRPREFLSLQSGNHTPPPFVVYNRCTVDRYLRFYVGSLPFSQMHALHITLLITWPRQPLYIGDVLFLSRWQNSRHQYDVRNCYRLIWRSMCYINCEGLFVRNRNSSREKKFRREKKLSAFKNVFIARQLLHSSGFGDVGTGLNMFARVISKLQHSCLTKFV